MQGTYCRARNGNWGRSFLYVAFEIFMEIKINIAQNYWISGCYPSSSVLETRKQRLSETGSVSVL
jgi:hypothetical protein